MLKEKDRPSAEKDAVARILESNPRPEGTWLNADSLKSGSSTVSAWDFDGWISPAGDVYRMSGREGHNLAAMVALGFHQEDASAEAIRNGFLYVSMDYDAYARGPETARIVTSGQPITEQQQATILKGFEHGGCIRIEHGETSHLIHSTSELEVVLSRMTRPAAIGLSQSALVQSPEFESVELQLQDPKGLHSRTALAIVEAIGKSNCQVTARCPRSEASADASSIVQLLMMGVRQGDLIEMRVSGPDKEMVLRNLLRLQDDQLFTAPKN